MERDADRDELPEPVTARVVAETVAAVAAVGVLLLLLHHLVHFHWDWIPWRKLIAVGVILIGLTKWCAHAIRSFVRRRRGLPDPRDARTERRDAWARRVRELDEPHARRERTTVGD